MKKIAFSPLESDFSRPGSFHRRFSLPDSANGEAICAKCKHGVLEITIPKREAVQPKRIQVTSEE
ncbi:Hsp20 family protein [Nitrincola sp. A-D6]|uniref:Hsp20/alpha crystallin family protein n=1 Tax=Nitrincola sp. A-D6 TaxID=1545442 RepID=UPI0009DDF37D